LLAAIRRTEPTVLLIDEPDKADVEVEGLLLEVLLGRSGDDPRDRHDHGAARPFVSSLNACAKTPPVGPRLALAPLATRFFMP
jgi:hypothetical protein